MFLEPMLADMRKLEGAFHEIEKRKKGKLGAVRFSFRHVEVRGL